MEGRYLIVCLDCGLEERREIPFRLRWVHMHIFIMYPYCVLHLGCVKAVNVHFALKSLRWPSRTHRIYSLGYMIGVSGGYRCTQSVPVQANDESQAVLSRVTLWDNSL
jgi:hypothetical protein